MTHALKVLPEFYDAVLNGSKTFELRKFDRPFMPGETIILQEYIKPAYTARELELKITHVLYAGKVAGLMKNFCIISFNPVFSNVDKLKKQLLHQGATFAMAEETTGPDTEAVEQKVNEPIIKTPEPDKIKKQKDNTPKEKIFEMAPPVVEFEEPAPEQKFQPAAEEVKPKTVAIIL